MTRDEVWRLLTETIAEVLPDVNGDLLQRQDTLQSLGANSMDRAEIVMLALERIRLRISMVETFGPRNIGELAEFLSEKSS